MPGAREAYLPIEGTDLDTEANQRVPLSLVGIIPINQSLPDIRCLKYRHERAQDRALDEQGKATELNEQLTGEESFCHLCPVLPSSRLKEGPPLVVPIEMWATLPKGSCQGSWENQLSMEGRVPREVYLLALLIQVKWERTKTQPNRSDQTHR